MIQRTVAELALPYRDPFVIQSFSFGIDEAGKPLSDGSDIDSFERSACFIAGLRGDEVQQTFVCARLVARLTEMEQAGLLAPGKLVMVIPCANPASMGIGWRFWPGDKTDINRMFPGYDKGEATQRVAAALFEHVSGYRYGVHFASFYLQGDFLPHVRVMHGPGSDGNNGADFGLPFVLHHVPGSFDTTTLHYNWRLWDTEAYSLYTKETELVDEESAENIVRSVLRFLNARGIVNWPDHRGYRSTQLGESVLVAVQTSTGGIFCPHVQLGDVIRKGHALASIVDPLNGSVKETLHAPCDGAVFYKARTPLVNEQTLAFQIVPPNVDDTSGSGIRGNFLDPEA
ncbi:MAG: succinylglutamate desuccinylase/aspartoacylase family protein [Eggerthellaceae bacterium]|nr:succinylglutamate desuccinylase/aspartoacylase family protein [Eggerthellaceae bacterium]